MVAEAWSLRAKVGWEMGDGKTGGQQVMEALEANKRYFGVHCKYTFCDMTQFVFINAESRQGAAE